MSGTSEPRDAEIVASRESTHDSGSSYVADEEDDEVPLGRERDRKSGTMSSYRIRDLVFLTCALTLSTFGAIYSSPKKVSKIPPAKPFFNESSVVLDFYKGHLGAMVDRVMSSDFSFIMFYAPWDAECQAAREEFEIVAKYYHSQIFFAAINCWHPGSDCRTHYNKILSYPVFMMYPPRDSGVQYRGILSAPYMIHFLSNFLNPITRVNSEQDLIQLLANHDSVILGFFNFNGIKNAPGYKEFYKTAIMNLEKDPNRDVAFAMMISGSAGHRERTYYPSATLFTSNGTLDFPNHKDWTTDNLLNWLGKARQNPILWLQPPGVKSAVLSNFLLSGPVLFLFTPRNILLPDNHNYDLLHSVGLEYHNCEQNQIKTKIINFLKEKITRAESMYENKTLYCTNLLSNEKIKEAPSVSPNLQHWINDSCCSEVVMNKCPVCKQSEDTQKVCQAEKNSLDEVCRTSDILYAPLNLQEQEKYDHCCSKYSETRQKEEQSERFDGNPPDGATKHQGETDPFSAESLMLHHEKDNCRRFLAGDEFLSPKFVDEVDVNATLTDVRCSSNRTLWFVAIDSVAYFHFADVFGMNVLTRPDKTAVIVVDSEQESQFVMEKRLTRSSLVAFINNFIGGWLKRDLRSESTKSSYGRKVRRCANLETNDTRVCVTELNTKTFLPTILDPDKDVVVFYHTPYCAFCSAVGYVFLTVANYLRHMDHVKFVRIDGDNNDLPWEYTMNRYPSILFFPRKRKEDSTVFPFDLPISIPNLVSFVLANLEGDTYVEALINICHVGAGESPRDCVRRIRLVCLDLTEEYLRAHRRLQRHLSLSSNRPAVFWRRRHLLVQLEHIRVVHLLLGSLENLQTNPRQVALLRQKFRDYYATLRSIEKTSEKKDETARRHLADEL